MGGFTLFLSSTFLLSPSATWSSASLASAVEVLAVEREREVRERRRQRRDSILGRGEVSGLAVFMFFKKETLSV